MGDYIREFSVSQFHKNYSTPQVCFANCNVFVEILVKNVFSADLGADYSGNCCPALNISCDEMLTGADKYIR